MQTVYLLLLLLSWAAVCVWSAAHPPGDGPELPRSPRLRAQYLLRLSRW